MPIAPTWWLTSSNWTSVRELVANQPDVKRWFLKPTIGASSINTLRFRPAEIDDACELLASKSGDVGFMLQPYLDTVESFGDILLYVDGVFSHSVRKVPVAGDYQSG